MIRAGTHVRMSRTWKTPLHDLVYPGLAERKSAQVIMRISDAAYPATIIGVEHNGAVAWVYERDAVEVKRGR